MSGSNPRRRTNTNIVTAVVASSINNSNTSTAVVLRNPDSNSSNSNNPISNNPYSASTSRIRSPPRKLTRNRYPPYPPSGPSNRNPAHTRNPAQPLNLDLNPETDAPRNRNRNRNRDRRRPGTLVERIANITVMIICLIAHGILSFIKFIFQFIILVVCGIFEQMYLSVTDPELHAAIARFFRDIWDLIVEFYEQLRPRAEDLGKPALFRYLSITDTLTAQAQRKLHLPNPLPGILTLFTALLGAEHDFWKGDAVSFPTPCFVPFINMFFKTDKPPDGLPDNQEHSEDADQTDLLDGLGETSNVLQLLESGAIFAHSDSIPPLPENPMDSDYPVDIGLPGGPVIGSKWFLPTFYHGISDFVCSYLRIY